MLVIRSGRRRPPSRTHRIAAAPRDASKDAEQLSTLILSLKALHNAPCSESRIDRHGAAIALTDDLRKTLRRLDLLASLWLSSNSHRFRVIVSWPKSVRPEGMSKEEYASLPSKITLREIRYVIEELERKLVPFVVVTTMLDIQGETGSGFTTYCVSHL